MPPYLPIFALAAAPVLSATRVDEAPKLDGRLDEPVWQMAKSSDAFTQKLPNAGAAPSERTVVRVLYDADTLYVGVDATQTQAEIIGRLTRRDRMVEADRITIAFDSRLDRKSAFEFSVNAAGVLSDAMRFNDTEMASEWDDNWQAMVARTDHGWSAEFKISLHILRFREMPLQRWGMQVRRYTSARQELDEWAYLPRDEGGEVSRYGILDNLISLRAHTPLELRPFVVGALRHFDPEGDTLARGFGVDGSLGLDLKWHISQELTLDATLLPDFGQVEVDQVILNLTTFEQFFPERRPFFLEGVDIFSTPLQLLYTRRIGRAPRSPALLEGETLVNRAAPSPIYLASKLSGNIGGKTTAGALIAFTGQNEVEVEGPRGETTKRLVDPLTTFKVFRLRQEIGERTQLGFMAMATNRLEQTAMHPRLDRSSVACPGGGTVRFGERCLHDAYVAGVDGRWRSPSGDYVLSGQAIASLMEGGPTRELRDGTTIASGDTGGAGQVKIAKEGGKHWIGRAGYEAHTRAVDYNDLGYMRRQNQQSFEAGVEYRNLAPWRGTLESHVGLDYTDRYNLDWLTQWRNLSLWSYTKFDNFWGIWAELHGRPSYFDDREIGDGAALERTGRVGMEVYMHSDVRKSIALELWNQLELVETGLVAQGDGKLTLRILPQFDMDLLPAWLYTVGEPRHIDRVGDSYIFGRLQAQSLSLTIRSTYTFTPRLSLQAYAQLFLDAQRYAKLSAIEALGKGQVIEVEDLRPYSGKFSSSPDGKSGAFNANLVLRWEYLLGSTLYVVYTHGQSGYRSPRWGSPGDFDFRLIRPRAAEDALLFKLSYWWG